MKIGRCKDITKRFRGGEVSVKNFPQFNFISVTLWVKTDEGEEDWIELLKSIAGGMAKDEKMNAEIRQDIHDRIISYQEQMQKWKRQNKNRSFRICFCSDDSDIWFCSSSWYGSG